MGSARHLDQPELVKTSQDFADWMSKEFPKAHLTQVAQEVRQLTQEAVARAAAIREPNQWLRGGVVAILAVIVFALIWQVVARPFEDLLHFLDITKFVGIYLVSALVFLVTLEVRLKRRKLLKAVHELRAMAHIIDMHQVLKDPLLREARPDKPGSRINEYLHACTALLALVSKIGQLYVENFPDAVAVRAVDDFESITTGLANKIWNKIHSLPVGPRPVSEGNSKA